MVNWANKVTLARIGLILVFLIALVAGPRWLAIVLYTVVALTDLIDGYLARKFKAVSRAGAVLDPLADKLLVCAALLFLANKGVEPWMAYVIVARELLVTGLRALVEKVIVANVWGKGKTLAQNVAVVWVLADLPFAYEAMLVATVLTVVSGVVYFWVARRQLWAQL